VLSFHQVAHSSHCRFGQIVRPFYLHDRIVARQNRPPLAVASKQRDTVTNP
jgi:hypothetical protein